MIHFKFLFAVSMLLPITSFSANGRMEDFIQSSAKNTKVAYVLVKGASWCNPCKELEKYTQTKSLKKYPRYQAAKKLFVEEDLETEDWKIFSIKYHIFENPAFPVVYIFRGGNLKYNKIASSPWEIEEMLTH